MKRERVGKKFKRRLCMAICGIIISCELISIVPNVYAASSSTLGTQSANGSPVLNDKFTTDSWDAWEMITWGIFLSNYCVPLVDSYESAFSTSASYGSSGNGLKALEFGSGNDAENNSVIQQLLVDAINFQNQTAGSKLYVSFTSIEDQKLGDKKDPNDASSGAEVREARFSDLFLLPKKPDNEDEAKNMSWANSLDTVNGKLSKVLVGASNQETADYLIFNVANGNLPTFYIQSNGKYIKVLDYTDSWDIQIVSAMLNKACSDGYKDEFEKTFKSMYGDSDDGTSSSIIKFDAFGNIVCNYDSTNRIVIPSCVNQHLTQTDNINLLNSWVLNGYTTNVNKTDVVTKGRQAGMKEDIFLLPDAVNNYLSTTQIISGNSLDAKSFGGTPAFATRASNGTLADGTTLVYKDSDTLVYNSDSGYEIGKLLNDIMENGELDSSLALKIETVNRNNTDYDRKQDWSGALHNTIGVSYMLSNMLNTKPTIGIDYIREKSGDKVNMFGDTILVSNQMKSATTEKKGKESDYYITRQLTNYMYDIFKSGVKTSYGEYKSATLKNTLSNCRSDDDICELYKDLYNYYKSSNSDYKNVKYNPKGDLFVRDDNAGGAKRFTVVQLPSDVLVSCANILGVKDGVEFSTYSTYIYMTYLEYYGINTGSSLGETGGSTTKLNKDLFVESPAKDYKIETIEGLISDEQKEKEVLNMSYLMLSNTKDGIAYRNKVNQSTISAFLSTQYDRLVYGSDNKSEVTSTGRSGFLNIDTLGSNPFASGLLSVYSSIAIWIMLGALVLVVLAGVILSKRPQWYLASTIMIVTIVLIMPSVGNISPTLSNRVVQSLFKSKMTYWSVSEQIENAKTDAELIASKDDNEDTSKEVAKLIDSLSLTAQDKTLLIKDDISSKVTTKLSDTYVEAQKLKSARWVLPILMEQITADDKSANYVYKNMANILDDASNMYLYYNNDYSDTMGTYSASSNPEGNLGKAVEAKNRSANYYADYKKTDNMTSYNGINYRNIGYYNSNYDTMSHTYFYLLEASGYSTTRLCGSSEKYIEPNDIESYQNYIDNVISTGSSSAWESTLKNIEEVGDEYDRTDRSTMNQCYGYLWNSESVYNYMYETVEDSLDATESIGSLLGKLQGQYLEDANGNEVRDTFMHALDDNGKPTGYSRDILDLQEFFTNNLPYMYKMWVSAGGFDGESGILGDTKIEGSDYYDGNDASWFFRCNWAIKLMENEDLNGKAVVYDSDGNRYTVENQLIPECYPDERPMVFSRAQEKAYGLKDSQLSYVELKCIKANEDTINSWTSMLNYAGASSITKEVILRQMALEATFNFNREFSTSINSKLQLYPETIDLRSLSFDSVMKMIMLNTTKNSSYIYGDTMEEVINNTDIITSSILLITALICSKIIPLIRNGIALLVLLLFVITLMISIFSSITYKGKICLGTLMSQMVMFGANAIYYLCMNLLVRVTSVDEVISVDAVKGSVETGSPIGALLVVLILSGAYIWIMIKLAIMFIKNRRDMGYEKYIGVIKSVTEKVNDSIERVGSRIRGSRKEKAGANGGVRSKAQSFVSSHRGYDTSSSVEESSKTKYDEHKDEKASSTMEKDKQMSNNSGEDEVKETKEKERINKEIEKGNKEEAEEKENRE